MANASLNFEKCHFRCMEGILLGHIISQDGIRTDCTTIEKVNFFPFSQDKETIANIFGASGLLPKVHQGVCNLGISPRQIFQTRVRDYGGRKGD
jgi:hypothetical protein